MSKNLKLKLLLYAVVSAAGFSYLVMPENSGISIVVFALIQLACLWFIVPDRKKLVLFAPIFVMSLNCFISASNLWRISNLLVSVVLYSCMFTQFNFKSDSLSFFGEVGERIFAPFTYFSLPFKWVFEINTGKAPIIKRVAAAIVISVPCVIILMVVLANADMVFSMKAWDLLADIFKSFSINVTIIILRGVIAGLYLFGVLYCAHSDRSYVKEAKLNINGDLIIINILLSAVLIVYTLFVIIQFKYLFAGLALPKGLTYTEYARKGFFELLSLTGINIAAILAVVKLTKKHQGRWVLFTKVLCHYLCVVTIVLLISSFYRMFLYTNDDGLTRLRFFVMGFLVFEAIGLVTTFVYIAKPKFNIALIYLVLALSYYTILNIIPTDNIIAKNQINKYLDNERTGLHYIFTLSADAAPAMELLFENTDKEELRDNVKQFIEEKTSLDIPQRWQRYNFSIEKAKRLLVDLK